MKEPDLVTSTLSQDFEKDGHTVTVDIYSTGKNDWILEVVDSEGTSTVWDGTFATDGLAFEEFLRTAKEEGIESIVKPVD